MTKGSVVQRSHHVRVVVGVPQSVVLEVIEGIEERTAPALRRAPLLMRDLLRTFEECASWAPGLSVIGIVVAEFSTSDEVDIDLEVHRRRSEIKAASMRFLESLSGWANGQFGKRTSTPASFVRQVSKSISSYSVVNSRYPIVPPNPSSPIPGDIAARMKRMKSDTLLGVLRWLARKLHDRDKISSSLLERVESETMPKTKGLKPKILEW